MIVRDELGYVYRSIFDDLDKLRFRVRNILEEELSDLSSNKLRTDEK
jgi:hypothetical protein